MADRFEDRRRRYYDEDYNDRDWPNYGNRYGHYDRTWEDEDRSNRGAYGRSRGYNEQQWNDQDRSNRGTRGYNDQWNDQERSSWRGRGSNDQWNDQDRFNRGTNYRSDYGNRDFGSRNRFDQDTYYDTDWDYNYEQPTAFVYEEWWLVPGPFTGVGPRGYQRSDDRICEDVNERLSRHGRLDASDIDIEVNDGEVTLKGTVNNRQDKRTAEDIVESVSGVRDVHNQLKIKHHQQMGQGNQQMGQGSMGQRQMGSGNFNRSDIHEGMEVVDSQGQHVGKVKEVRDRDFLLDRQMAGDIYVPFDACRMSEGKVMLQVTSSDIDKQNWPAQQSVETPNLPK